MISETKIFRLGVSLICLLYVKEEWIGKKYNTERYNKLRQMLRTFWHIYNKWSIMIIQYKSTLNLHLLYMNISQHIHTMVTLVSIQIIFSSWFYLFNVTSRNRPPNCEYDPCYQQRSQSNLVKAFFDLHGEVLTGFKHSFKKQPPKVFYKKSCS